MIIRQNPVLSCGRGEESRHFCANLAQQSIDAIAAFASACPRIRSSGYFISTALVECIYHLVYILQDKALRIDRQAVLDSFRHAYQLLLDFAQTWITAKRALQALSSAIFSGGDANALFEALSQSQNEQSDRMDESPQEVSSQNSRSPTQSLSDQMFQRSGSPNLAMVSMQTPTMTDISNQILQQESQQQRDMRYAGDSGFMRDLANSYGDLDFDCPPMIFGRV